MEPLERATRVQRCAATELFAACAVRVSPFTTIISRKFRPGAKESPFSSVSLTISQRNAVKDRLLADQNLEMMMREGALKPIAMRLALMMAFLPPVVVLPGAAVARDMPLNTAQFVNVNVGISVQIPLSDESEETLVSKQRDARKFIYRMASKECKTLKETIARTCRMTNLNISSQIRDHGDQRPSKLHLNGNARFSITLKEDGVN